MTYALTTLLLALAYVFVGLAYLALVWIVCPRSHWPNLMADLGLILIWPFAGIVGWYYALKRLAERVKPPCECEYCRAHRNSTT